MNSTKKIDGISVVLPCLNEAGSVAQAVSAVKKGIARLGLRQSEIIVVDNASTDGSAEKAAAAGARVIFEPHRGYGAALRAGFKAAKYELLAMGDADLTYDFEKLDELAAPILEGKADFAIGNRMRSIRPGAMPRLHRYVGNPVLSLALRAMFRSNAVHDAHCGLRAITREAYEQLGCVATGMEFASEMVVRAIQCGLRIAERDIIYHPRVGVSKLRSFRDGWRHLRLMILHSPTLLLLAPGAALWILGMAAILPLAFGPIVICGRLVDIHFMLLGGVLNIISIQIITIGLLAKAYAHLSGLYHDAVVAWFYRWFTFEKAMLAAAALLAAGAAVIAAVVAEWGKAGFGPLDKPRLLFFAVVCLVNGVQIGAASMLFSIMALPRHLDRLPDQARDTVVADV